MSVIYTRSDGVGRKIVPAPLVTINKSYEARGDGTKQGSTYAITLTGTFLPYRGSPSGNYSDINDSFWSLGGYPPDQTAVPLDGDAFNSLLRKQEAIRWLFSEDGGTLEWQPSDGQPPMKCYPKVVSINFPEGQWADRCDYAIEFEAPWIFINGTLDVEDTIALDLVSASTETWSFEEIAGREGSQYKVSHDVSANGKTGYDGVGGLYDSKYAWEHAKDFVDTKVSGIVDNDIMLAAIGATDKVAGQYSKVTRVDKDGGSYGSTETWTLSDTSFYEEKQFTVDYDQDQDEYSITYQGTIHGVTGGSNDGSASNMLQAKTHIPSTAEARTLAISYVGSLIGDKIVPTYPDKKTYAFNQQNGTVAFTYQWNTSDTSSVFTTEDAQHSHNVDSLLNTLTFTQTIEGKGDSSTAKLGNAKGAAYGNAAALVSAKDLASTTLSYDLSSTVKSFDKRQGIVKISWTWTDRGSNNVETTIQTQEANPTIVSIPIPGRAAGPIVQNMNTLSSRIITVTIRSKRNTSRPVLNTSQYGDSGLIISDTNAWNPETGMAERTTRFLRTT